MYSPNWNNVRNAVLDAFDIFPQTSIPVDIFGLINHLELPIATFSQFSDITGYTVEDVKKLIPSDDGGLISFGSNMFILYNDVMTIPQRRMRFTLAHEIGHFLLGHYDLDIFAVDATVSKKELDPYESEANLFASYFLVPPVLLPTHMIYSTTDLTNNDYNYISEKFDVSTDVAQISLTRMFDNTRLYVSWKNRLQFENILYLTLPKLGKYLPEYGPGIISARKFSFCNTCQAVSFCFYTNFKYCPVCASTSVDIDIFDLKFHETKERNMIDYPKYNVSGTPSRSSLECPRCGVSIIHANDFCEVCGTYLINRCTGQSLEGFTIINNRLGELYVGDNGWSEAIDTSPMALKTNIDLKGCNSPCSGKARFCSSCGSVTTYHIQNLFTYWPDERSALINEAIND